MRPVNLNTASRTELMKLPGVGEAEAKRIVEGRPYKSKTDLVTKKVLEFAVYDQLKRHAMVEHRKAPARPRPAASTAAPAAIKPAS